MTMTSDEMQTKFTPAKAPHERAVRPLPLLASLGLIVFTLVAVTIGRMTSDRVPPVGAVAYVSLGNVNVSIVPDGAITFAEVQSGAEIITYPAGLDQFAAGALRSLARLTRAPYDATPRTVEVLQMRGGLVFLRDPQSGEKINLDAFSRTKAKDLSQRVAVANKIGGSNQ